MKRQVIQLLLLITWPGRPSRIACLSSLKISAGTLSWGIGFSAAQDRCDQAPLFYRLPSITTRSGYVSAVR